MFLLITITNAISRNGNRDWIMWGGSLGDQSDSSDFPSATCHWHRNIFLINLSCHDCVWTKGPGPHLYGFVTKSCPLPCIVGFLSWAPGPATWDTTLTFSDNFSVRLSPWVAGSSLCFKSSVPDAGMVKERALCPISPSAHGDSFPCHIFLHSPCYPQSIPNPVWPVLPQIPLQFFLTSSEASVTGVSISRGKYELSPLPWRETMDSLRAILPTPGRWRMSCGCFLLWPVWISSPGAGSLSPGPASFLPCPYLQCVLFFFFLPNQFLSWSQHLHLDQNLLHLKILIKSYNIAVFAMQLKPCHVCREDLNVGM